MSKFWSFKTYSWTLLFLALIPTPQLLTINYKNFVIVINSYNNERFCVRNINSALDQNYPTDHFRIILTCDQCTDQTYELAAAAIKQHANQKVVTLVNNSKRKGALCNFYEVIHQKCQPDWIVVTLDGDDFLIDNDVLSYLNTVYADNNIWLTYGSYKFYPDSDLKPGARPYPAHIIKSSNFRQHDFVASHLRTFYAWLFRKIKLEDLKDTDGEFYSVCPDVAIMLPLLEMAGIHHKFIDKALYLYNISNPLNENAVNHVNLINQTTTRIHKKAKYAPLDMGPKFLYK